MLIITVAISCRYSWPFPPSSEGRVYRLIFKDFYERVLLNEHDPELKRAPLDKVILDVKLLDMGPPKEVLALALDPPNLRNIKTCVHWK